MALSSLEGDVSAMPEARRPQRGGTFPKRAVRSYSPEGMELASLAARHSPGDVEPSPWGMRRWPGGMCRSLRGMRHEGVCARASKDHATHSLPCGACSRGGVRRSRQRARHSPRGTSPERQRSGHSPLGDGQKDEGMLDEDRVAARQRRAVKRNGFIDNRSPSEGQCAGLPLRRPPVWKAAYALPEPRRADRAYPSSQIM